MTFTKKEPPEWLLAFWKEIDDKTFGKGLDCGSKPIVKPVMSHFFYMDEKEPTRVRPWIGAVVPLSFRQMRGQMARSTSPPAA
jgi:hypothetical protein